MNKILITFALFVGSFFYAQQVTPSDFKALTKDQKKEALSKMSLEDKKSFLRQVREDELIKELGISTANEKNFRQVFNDYQKKAKDIKMQFKPKGNFGQLTDQEAKTELDNSFVVGQQLMDNRKKYSQEFLKFLSPKQVLQLFHYEMKMREKIEDRKNHSKEMKGNSMLPTDKK
jgi:hypothetical protein